MEDGETEEAQRDTITARMRAQDYAGARALLLWTLQTLVLPAAEVIRADPVPAGAGALVL
jgi:hypothetical protein